MTADSPPASIGIGSTSVRQGFARETQASRAKTVQNSASQGRTSATARRVAPHPVTTQGSGIVQNKTLEKTTGLSERTISRMTTDTMDSSRDDMARHSPQPTVPSPIHSLLLRSTALPGDPGNLHTPAQEFLQRNGWRVDINHNVLICLECKSIINPDRVRDHVMSFHREVHPDRQLQAQFTAACGLQYGTLTFNPAHPLDPVPVIEGLKLQKDMQICSVCKRGFGCDKDRDQRQESRSFKKHVCKKGEENGERGFSLWPAQKFGQNFSWFAVNAENHPPVPPRDIWQEYQSMKASRAPSASSASIPDDYRVLNQFLQKERWLEHVQGVDGSVAMEICSCPAKDPVFGSLPRRVHAFLAKYQGKSNSYFLQRIIGTRPDAEHGKNYPRHHRAVHYDAHAKYSRSVAGALALLLHNVINPNKQYRFPVPQQIAQAARELYSKLQAVPNAVDDLPEDDAEEGNADEPDSDDEDHYPAGEALPTVSPDIAVDDDIWPTEGALAEDPALEAVEDRYPYGMSETRDVPTFEDETQECLLELIQLLYTQNLNNGPDNIFCSVFVRYTVLSSMRQNGQWRLASVITQTIAAILFAGRLTMAKIMLEFKSSTPGVPLSM